MHCLDENTVLAILDGNLAANRLAHMDEHMAECQECRQLVAHLAKSSQASLPTGNDATLPAGTMVGRYEIIELVGRGATGAVYSARDPELDRKIAIKLLRTDLSEQAWRDARARLLREGRAIAKLSHPNTVTVFDVGQYGENAFVAMEYIEGESVAQWLAVERRSPKEIARVFLQAGRGLAAAHAKSLVHRDVKPANILLAQDGHVCMGDFGLARPGLASAGEEIPGDAELALSATGALSGTPLYMAPELLEGEAATAASDQYSFGVSLFEALKGSPPAQGPTLRELREQKQDSPSLEGMPGSARLHRAVARMCSPDPSARFPDMEAALRAIAPRSIRPLLLAGAGALVAGGAAIAFGLASPAEATPCTGAEDHLREVWTESRAQEVAAAFAVPGSAAFQRLRPELDRYAQSWASTHEQVCKATEVHHEQSVDLLDLRMGCLHDKLRSMNALLAVFTDSADATTITNSVQAAYTLPDPKACILADSAVPLPDDPQDRKRIEEAREELARAEALTQAGQYQSSLELVDSIRDQKIASPSVEAQIELLTATNAYQLGDYKRAEESFHKAAKLAVSVEDDLTSAQAWTLLVGVVGYLQARPEEGHTLAKMAEVAILRARAETSLGPELDHMRGLVLDSEGKYDEARVLHQRALQTRRKHLGLEHPLVAQSLDNLGAIPYMQGKYEEAEAIYQQAADIRIKVLGPKHPDYAASLNGLGAAQMGQRKVQAAKKSYQEALAIWNEALGADHPNIAAVENNLGNVHRELGEYEEARTHIQRALELWEESLGVDHSYVASALTNLGIVSLKLGRLDEARGYLERALAHDEKTKGIDHPSLASSLVNLGRILQQQESWAEAEALHTRAHGIAVKGFGDDHVQVANALVGIGLARLAQRKPAKELLARSVEIYEAQEKESGSLPAARFGLARSLVKGNRARALALAEKAREGADPDVVIKIDAWLATQR